MTVQSLTEENGSLTRGQTRCARGLNVAGGQLAIERHRQHNLALEQAAERQSQQMMAKRGSKRGLSGG